MMMMMMIWDAVADELTMHAWMHACISPAFRLHAGASCTLTILAPSSVVPRWAIGFQLKTINQFQLHIIKARFARRTISIPFDSAFSHPVPRIFRIFPALDFIFHFTSVFFFMRFALCCALLAQFGVDNIQFSVQLQSFGFPAGVWL